MRSFKGWLIDRFLPEYCREEMEQIIKGLTNELEEARRRIERQEAYINGLHTALRAGRKIVIKNGGGCGGDCNSDKERLSK